MTVQDVLVHLDGRCQFLEKHFESLPFYTCADREQRAFVHGQWGELDILRAMIRTRILDGKDGMPENHLKGVSN